MNVNLLSLPDTFSASFLPYVPTLRQKRRAMAFHKERFVHSVKLTKENDAISIVARCYPSQKKRAESHRIDLIVITNQDTFTEAYCNCKAGYNHYSATLNTLKSHLES